MRKFFIIFFAVLLLAIVPLASVSAQQQQYVVQYGDTLSGIALIYQVSLNQVLTLNNLTMAQARNVPVGPRLLIRRV